MGLITEEVEIRLFGSNIKHYLEQGYKPTPRYTKEGKISYHNIIIKVKTKDLPEHSLVRVDIQCDDCKKISNVSYNSYTQRNRNGICYCHACASKRMRGENAWNWNFNKTKEERENLRHINGYQDFVKEVLARDNYTCRCCGKSESGKMIAHHLNGYNWFIDGRIDPNNGITLCENCHENFHSIYGKGNNTKEQFEEWIGKSIEIIKYQGELPKARKVYCFEDDKVYNSAVDAAIVENIKNDSQIYNVCNRRKNFKTYTKKDGTIVRYISPSLTINGKHFIWYDEYLKMSNEEISDYLSPNKHFKKVICLTTGKIFDSITYAIQYYKCGKHIVDCCKGKRETCGKLQDGTKLSWMYYDDYLKNYNNNFNDMAS